MPDICPFHPDLAEYLRKAEEEGTTVVMVVDSWTLGLEDYRAIMEKVDQSRYVGFKVIVVKNEEDIDFKARPNQITEYVENAFPRATSDASVVEVKDAEELATETKKLVVKLSAQVRKFREARARTSPGYYIQVPRHATPQG